MKDDISRRIKVSKDVGDRILSILERPLKKPSKQLLEMAQQYNKTVQGDDC